MDNFNSRNINYTDTDSVRNFKSQNNALYGKLVSSIYRTIKLRLHNNGYAPLKLETGNWIDLLIPSDIILKKFEFRTVPLDISMELPPNTEAHICLRSSAFKRYHVIQTNGVGIIDNSYNGDDDIWAIPLLAMEDTHIPAGTRIAQFRIMPVQPDITFDIVPSLNNNNRGGFGSTGV